MRFFILPTVLFFTMVIHGQPGFIQPGSVRLIDSIACTSIKDQSSTPTCWAFGTNSLFESDYLRRFGKNINLSEMYIARYAYIDKANRFLATGGTTYFEGGGQFHDVLRVIERYGLMPEEAYNGRPDEFLYHHHERLDSGMQKIVRRFLAEGKKELAGDDLKQVNDTLDKYLGAVPSRFLYDGKWYTPLAFAKEVVQFEDDYVELVSFADHPLYKRFILQDKYNWALDSFYNITLDELKQVVDTALHKGWTIGWEGDVTEDGFNYFGGYASLPDGNHRYDKERLLNYKSEATERDHMLHIVGAGIDENNIRWYYAKNSWGKFNKYGGYLYMEENYFRLKTVILFVRRTALPDELRRRLGL